jgi:hypothetical protein
MKVIFPVYSLLAEEFFAYASQDFVRRAQRALAAEVVERAADDDEVVLKKTTQASKASRK